MSIIKIAEDNVDLVMQRINQVASSFEGIFDGGLSSLTGVPLIGEGVQKIRKNVGKIKDRTGNTSKIISRQKDSFMNGELLITGMFDAIEIPTELNNVYSPTGEVSNNIQVIKNDGMSVNNGSAANESKIDFVDNFERENITNIVKDQVLDKQFEDKYKENIVNLSNISNDNGIKLANFDDIKSVEYQKVDTVKTNSDVEQKELGTNYDQLTSAKIENINNNANTEQKELGTNYDQIMATRIENINNTNSNRAISQNNFEINTDGTIGTRIENINNTNSNRAISQNNFEINTDGTIGTRITNIYNPNGNAVIDENVFLNGNVNNNEKINNN